MRCAAALLAALLFVAASPAAPPVSAASPSRPLPSSSDIELPDPAPTTSADPATVPVTTAAEGERAISIGAILVNFPDDGRVPFSKAAVQSALSGPGRSVKTFFEEESRGRWTVSSSAFGPYTLSSSRSPCSWSAWRNEAIAAAEAHGVDLSSFTNVMVIWPAQPDCGFAGRGTMPGRYTMINGTLELRVLAHEIGHNLGMNHASAYVCTDGRLRFVALSATCEISAYGDPYSVMGYLGTRHDSGTGLAEIGLQLPGAVQVAGDASAVYRLTPYFRAAAGDVTLLRVPRGDDWFLDIDVRTRYGRFDDFAKGSRATSGVMIRLTRSHAASGEPNGETYLLSAGGPAPDAGRSTLLVGQHLTDPVSGVTISLLGLDGAGARVGISADRPPSAPGTLAITDQDGARRLDWTDAVDDVGVTGYTILRDGRPIAQVDPATLTYTDVAAPLDRPVSYAVRARDGAGRSGPALVGLVSSATTFPVTGTLDEAPPGEPRVGATSAGTSSAEVSWQPAADDTAVAFYEVLRISDGRVIGTTTDTSIVIEKLRPHRYHDLAVRAVDAAGRRGIASTFAVRTRADSKRPTIPTGVRIVRKTERSVVVAWDPSADDDRVARYRITIRGRHHVWISRDTRVRLPKVHGAIVTIRAVDRSGNRSRASAHLRIP